MSKIISAESVGPEYNFLGLKVYVVIVISVTCSQYIFN